ncbi:MAG TPA: YlxR family protein [Candidatus Desulfovibrio intestinipullorum]|uniref:YlxR family protein n=1 Tax=Candidatus Desulfovibrio intestinipullorum TaxID=2838536 RepID=A0A9D1TQK2_9BACT|nr:YlxR family protein [Candidatus Desulfovibrio intestinipullorum]
MSSTERQSRPTGQANADSGPVRMCVICRQRAPKAHLLRHVLSADGSLVEDTRQTCPGRGWYVCSQETCRKKFARFRPARRRKAREDASRDRELSVQASPAETCPHH